MSSESNIRLGVDNYSVLRNALKSLTTKIRVREKISNIIDIEVWAPFIDSPNIFFNLIRKARI